MIYELFYLIGENKSPELEKIKREVKSIVENQGGRWLDPEILEKRKMAYKIKGQQRGVYVARRFELSENAKEEQKNDPLQNISKQLKLSQDILRFMLVKASEIPQLKSREEIKREDLAKKNPRQRLTEHKMEKKATEKNEINEEKEDKSIEKKLEEILNN